MTFDPITGTFGFPFTFADATLQREPEFPPPTREEWEAACAPPTSGVQASDDDPVALHSETRHEAGEGCVR